MKTLAVVSTPTLEVPKAVLPLGRPAHLEVRGEHDEEHEHQAVPVLGGGDPRRGHAVRRGLPAVPGGLLQQVADVHLDALRILRKPRIV